MNMNFFKKHLKWVLTVALLSLGVFLAYGFVCENNVFKSFVKTCTSLGITNTNGMLVLFLGLTMACLDGWVLLCLTLFKHMKASNTIHMVVFLGNVLIVVTAGLPLFWEANTDSSFAMFALYKNTPLFWLYATVIGISLLSGLAMLKPYVKGQHVVLVQTTCLIASDIPMFLAGFFGLPIGVLTNVCVNIFFAGLGLKLSQIYQHRIRIWTQTPALKRFKPNQKTDFVPSLFAFLAISRLFGWALASVYGPTNWCENIQSVFAGVLFWLLCAVWVYASCKLWLASLNPTVDERFLPFEPVLVYTRLVHPYVIVFGTYVNLQNLAWYRKIMRFCKPGLTRSGPMFKRMCVKFLAYRLSLISAILFCRMPNPSELRSPWLSELDQQTVILYASRTPISQTTAGQAWKMLGGVSGLTAFLGLGVLGMHNVEVAHQIETTESNVDLIELGAKKVNVKNLTPGNTKVYDPIMDFNAQRAGVVNQAKKASFLSASESKSHFSDLDGREGTLLLFIRRQEGFEHINQVSDAVSILEDHTN